MNKHHVIVAGIVFIVAVAAVLFLVLRIEDTTSPTALPAVSPKAVAPDERGPRPTATRLRNGARQIENAADALAAAEKSLARVESELASTTDAGKRKTLEQQKSLIEAAITKLKK